MKELFDTISGKAYEIAVSLGKLLDFNAIFTLSILFYVVLLFIFLCVDLVGHVACFKRALLKANKFLSKNVVTDDNLEYFNKLISRFPETVRMGWACFIDNGGGYPSEFITEYDCVRVPTVKYKKRNGLTVLLLLSAIFECLTFSIMACSVPTLSAVTSPYSPTFETHVLPVMGISIMLAIVCYSIMTLVYNRGEAKIFRLFIKFQALLDAKVAISGNVEAEVLEPLPEIEQKSEEEKQKEGVVRLIQNLDAILSDDEVTKEEMFAIRNTLSTYLAENELDEELQNDLTFAISKLDYNIKRK